MEYKPKIITGRVKDTGWPIDGHVLYFSSWDYDNHEFWHLYGWDDADDEAVMLTMYEQEEIGTSLRTFTDKWKAKQWVPAAPFVLIPDCVEVLEVKQQEIRNEARDRLLANGINLDPWKNNDRGGILCLPLDENLNGDTQKKHPDWEPMDCPHCGRKCWKPAGVDKLQKEQGVQLLCTHCALEAGLIRPYRPNNAQKPGGNRTQRRRAKHERKKR